MSRKPRTFAVPGEAPAPSPKPTKARKPRALADDAALTFQADDLAQRLPVALDEPVSEPPPKRRRAFSWRTVLFASLGALLSLSIGRWVEGLVRELLQRESWLGYIAMALVALIVIAAIAIAIREMLALRRLTVLDDLREKARAAIQSKDRKAALAVGNAVSALYEDRSELKRGREEVASHADEVIDATDMVQLTERHLVSPLDARARALTMASAKRVSVVTAVSPRALVDVAYVLLENTRLIRAIGELYGARPGTLGFWRLARNVVGHLAVTGTLAVGDGLVQGLVGHGIAAKVSTRLGEGVVNGVLTARIGIAAMEVCRPLPFSAAHRPKVGEFLTELTPWTGDAKAQTKRGKSPN